MRDKYKGMLYMAFTAIMWSTGGFLTKLIPWHPMTIAGFRSLITAVVVGCFIFMTRRRIIFSKVTFLPAFFVGLNTFCYMTATKLTTAANATMLQFTAPIFVMVFGILFRQKKARTADFLVIITTLSGIALCFVEQLGGGTTIGNLVAVGSGLCLAFQFMTTGAVGDDERLSAIFIGSAMAACVGVPTAFVFATPITDATLICILVLGIFQLGIPYITYAMAAKYTDALSCSLISALEPIGAPIWVYFIVGETPGTWAFVGGILVIISVSVWCLWDGKQEAAVPVYKEMN